ncbi:AlpA family transcriptional regulator [Aurantimonas sp. HBX-1]|uniref:helix-turn-helix transcriptional regulator n=1 Tax=Aurantimonas sp. HBX-1 TaxID=2906072 RepID=UPI001F2F672F|nr:AlpA family phage regulatory protein [Aurantimonas sp. HBX-1]UIJ74291.1 AlpA family phage regulatory protein [Aurantimonas sp. HBX-1]
MPSIQSSDCILSIRQVRAIVGLSRSTIWRLCRSGDFPNSITLSPGRVGWSEQAVRAWITQKMEPDRVMGSKDPQGIASVCWR